MSNEIHFIKNHNPRKGTETRLQVRELLSPPLSIKNHNPRKGTETFVAFDINITIAPFNAKKHNPRKGTE